VVVADVVVTGVVVAGVVVAVVGVVGGVVVGVVGGVVVGVVGGVVVGVVGVVGGVVVDVGTHSVLLMVSTALSSEPVKVTVATAVAGMSNWDGVTKNCSAPWTLPWTEPCVVVDGAPFWYVTTRVPLWNVVLPPGVKIQ
jgi:hypothetical protein